MRFYLKKVLRKVMSQRPVEISENIVSREDLFKNKRTIVFGGGTGIGKAITNKLLSHGSEVIICSRSNHEIEGAINEIWDVSDIGSIQENFNNIIKKYGQIDMVVNSQGILTHSDFLDVSPEEMELVFKTNIESVFFICQYAVRYFKNNSIYGHILNICSTEGLKGTCYPYGLSKAAAVRLTQGLGKVAVRDGIIVNGIAPGATATDMMRQGDKQNWAPAYGIPSGRMCTANEIANAAVFLLSDAGRQMCGEVMVVDGGESLH